MDMATAEQILAASIECTRCGRALALADAIRDYGALCHGCGAVTWANVFPAAFQPVTVREAEPLADDSEASCFYHPSKRAAIHCDSCGRFLCALCEIELGSEHLCPACLEAGRHANSFDRLANHRVLYDSIALALAVVPALFVWTAILGAPAALYVAVKYRKAPGSLVPRRRVRFVVAIVLASLELAAFGFLIAALIWYRG
jgi:hypothetical protein